MMSQLKSTVLNLKNRVNWKKIKCIYPMTSIYRLYFFKISLSIFYENLITRKQL